ncbi:hypothetical protein QR680_015519 [Steinernema hermaphroditum]|uniref:Unspecific monooxygenase n=1 Tax=Steinernema hermaphroditum TaxID=289476 RepID=A0AA39LKD0_9BILA|nr:hypothetical protein QR680_015519 [Steinernema hermaphroditum]
MHCVRQPTNIPPTLSIVAYHFAFTFTYIQCIMHWAVAINRLIAVWLPFHYKLVFNKRLCISVVAGICTTALMVVSLYLTVVVVSIYAFVAYLVHQKRKNLPPGPTPWPLFGNLPDFFFGSLQGKNTVQLLTEWKKNFGGVFTVWLGSMPVVNVCDYKTTIDSFVRNGEAHTGRFQDYMFRAMRNGYGVIFSEGPLWQEQRRFTLHVLRNFGLGRNLMQTRILEEVEYSFGALDRKIEKSGKQKVVINPAELLDPLIGSIINKILTGCRFDESNMAEFVELKHSLDKSLASLSFIDGVLLNEFTTKLPGFKQRSQHLMEAGIAIIAKLKKTVEQRKVQIANGTYLLEADQPNDYIDAYLSEMEKRRANHDDMGYFNEDSLVVNLMDLWAAGMETTILTLCWCLIYLLNAPEVQDKARMEILNCTGGNRDVELDDKKNLPYLSAVVTETQRLASIVTFNLIHKTTTKTVVDNYMIPEGTSITHQISVIMSNEDEFKGPLKFNPDRFIGTKLEQQVIAFGVGKRSCLGESLARAELFLILGNLLQRYKISVPNGQKPPSTEELNVVGVMHRCKSYECAFEKVM